MKNIWILLAPAKAVNAAFNGKNVKLHSENDNEGRDANVSLHFCLCYVILRVIVYVLLESFRYRKILREHL